MFSPRAILILAVLSAPSIASAGAWSRGCAFSGGDLAGTVGTAPTYTASDRVVGINSLWCYRFNNADSTHTSPTLLVISPSALITFDPQLDAEVAAATTALVKPRLCTAGSVLTEANPERSCISLGGVGANATLDGVEGPAGTQNAAIRVGPGVYVFQVTGACLAGDTCQISVRGEGDQP